MTKSPKFRLTIVAIAAIIMALAISESRRQPEPMAWCDLGSMQCYDRLGQEATR